MSEPKPASSGTGGNAGDPYRVMVVDDSAVIRGLLTRALEQDPTIKVAASVGNGEAALKALDRHAIDVIILAIEMPGMDGPTALPKLHEAHTGGQGTIASPLTRTHTEVTLRARTARSAAPPPQHPPT